MTNAELFENAFYSGKVTETSAAPDPDPEASGVDPELVMKLLSNPEMASLLKTLAQNLAGGFWPPVLFLPQGVYGEKTGNMV